MKNCSFVLLILLLWMSATTTLAQTPDLEQLKTKLQQLDQMVQDLKKQIASVEANENTPQPPAGAKEFRRQRSRRRNCRRPISTDSHLSVKLRIRIPTVPRESMRRLSTRHYAASSDYRVH